MSCLTVCGGVVAGSACGGAGRHPNGVRERLQYGTENAWRRSGSAPPGAPRVAGWVPRVGQLSVQAVQGLSRHFRPEPGQQPEIITPDQKQFTT
ncbi:hypothetical protein GCM10022236_41610 [Microlunatus ginsengisoli]|uniref:Secreted protein n=1 Tax=Microlunatus ginsengisoli TaxID=363863 RepID=A0ABP7AKY9_9ACTN